MTIPRPILALLLAAACCAATVIDGGAPGYVREGNTVVSTRPTGKADDGKPITVRDYELRNIRDQVGIFVRASHKYSNDFPPAVASSVTLERITASDFRRTLAGHCEPIFVGGSEDAARPVDLTIRDVTVARSDTGSPPLFISGGHFRVIVLDNIRSDRPISESSVMLDLKGDPADTSAVLLLVTNSPVKIIIQGHEKAVGAVVTDGTARIETATTQYGGKPQRPVVPVRTIRTGMRVE
jgi:hypothetical protein